MYSKLLIKSFLIVCAVNIALLGSIFGETWMYRLALGNIVALFIILFQERDIFSQMTTSGRVLFAPDVFFWIGLTVAIVCAGSYTFYDGSFLGDLPWLVGFLGGGLFYTLSLWLFDMYAPKKWHSTFSTKALVWLLMLGLLYILFPRQRQDISLPSRDTWTESSTWLESGDNADRDNSANNDDLGEDPKDDATDDTSVSTGDQQQDTDKDDTEDTRTGGEHSIFVDVKRDATGLTFGNFLPVLKRVYALPDASQAYTFSYVGKNSDLYDAFATARAQNMIGSATRPEQPIQCRHLAVLLGLAEGWDLEYTSDSVFDVYMQAAKQRGYSACDEPTRQATFADLP